MVTPEFFNESEKRHSSTDHFIIDDLLNFPNDDYVNVDETNYDDVGDVTANAGTSTDSSIITTAVDSCNSSGDGGHLSHVTDSQFSHDLCVPYDDMTHELEWLSNFVEESFSTEDMEKLQLISGIHARPDNGSETNQFHRDPDNRGNNPIFNKDMMVPGKARTKRSRAASSSWKSRLLDISQPSKGPTVAMSSESESDIASSSIGKKTVKAPSKKKEVYDHNESQNGDGRRCLHCATDKTPQWRTGPLGPKTLCNACGVRYKSGRLVPEYRPAASPTFVLAKHSNSHRKVLELRRQKEMQNAHQQTYFHHQNMMFNVPKGDDYLIHQHLGPDYRQLI
ncbi:GATA transcription factor 12-like [Rutidosis leptorrhynchoides]|uniref:GATA transcription factor 12-like n=1 Tax=Rutidosis leptorrhynchoides TaxID=125765 RepID=UPI003A99D684